MLHHLFFALLIIITQTLTTANSAPLIPTELLKRVTTPQFVTLDGTVEAVKKATMSAQVSGRITSVKFDVDDFVEKGAVIITIRNKKYKAQLKSAKAQLKEARAKLKDAQLEFNRVKGLFNDKIVSESKLDKAKAALKASEARVSASQASITQAEEQLENTKIRAPFSGIVTKRHIEEGESIRIGQSLMTGFSMAKLRVTTDIPQNYLSQVRQHNHAVIISPDDKALSFPTKEITIFPSANPKTHTFRVRAELPSEVKGIFPGMLVKISFEISKKSRLLIPNDAIVYRSEVIAVYVKDTQSKIHLRQVRLGRQFDKRTEVLAGLMEDEEIFLNPIEAGIQLKQHSGNK